MHRPHRAGSLSVGGRRLTSVCVPLSVCPVLYPKSTMEGRENWQEGRPVTPFRGLKVRGQGNKVTSQDSELGCLYFMSI